eukprot:Hpha_TRINITY_DN16384_c1_g1::TRINITY_DN16384_c1_g1_i1::g.62940::m.62940
MTSNTGYDNKSSHVGGGGAVRLGLPVGLRARRVEFCCRARRRSWGLVYWDIPRKGGRKGARPGSALGMLLLRRGDGAVPSQASTSLNNTSEGFSSDSPLSQSLAACTACPGTSDSSLRGGLMSGRVVGSGVGGVG